MELPILDKLKDGKKFDFETLVDNVEQTAPTSRWPASYGKVGNQAGPSPSSSSSMKTASTPK